MDVIIMFIEYLPSNKDIKILKNIDVEPEVLDSIKADLMADLIKYDALSPDLKYNVNPVFKWHSEVIDSIFEGITSLYDVLMLVRFSFNTKLGNKILIFNLSAYFNCYGIHSKSCSCSKICYAGKLAIRQLKKTISNYIFYQYVKRTSNLKLLELGIIYGVNKAIESVKGSISDLKAIRFNEVGEIKDSLDLFYMELIYYYLRQFKKNLKAYTYTTNKEFINLLKTSDIVIRISAGLKPEAIDQDYYNSWSVIVEPENIQAIKKAVESKGFKFVLCQGTCKKCISCSHKYNVIGFVNHSGTSSEALKLKINECMELIG